MLAPKSSFNWRNQLSGRRRKRVRHVIPSAGNLRRFILLGLLTSIAFPVWAAKSVTVAELEKVLARISVEHKPDAEMARQIAGMKLSERVTEATLGQLSAHLDTSSQAALALQLLADQSVFLDPPPGELPTTSVPDDGTQQRMLEAVRNYVAQTLPRLPNLLATRSTRRYDDSSQELKRGGWPVRLGLHLVDNSSREISVRDERSSLPSAVWQEQSGLISKGEFGSTLGMILADTSKGKMTWSHWEQIAGNPVAVFQYAVPRSASSYEVVGYQQRAAEYASLTGRQGVAGIGPQLSSHSSDITPIITRPGYHGSLSLDPTTGTILRITIEADPKGGAPFQRASILVEYGPVQIGDIRLTCPVRSVAFYEATAPAQVNLSDTPTEWLNVVLFTGYHRFGSTVKILTEKPAPE